ncbi:unnamed protein product [Trifolium pratense]|uniref:Uncharacterized protein n=1 Tax=Trifolium pratense TaxID=57577 RepID=A0ACB0L237_TRIPR|nr:unnamed protein product [Trifolium pratense]
MALGSNFYGAVSFRPLTEETIATVKRPQLTTSNGTLTYVPPLPTLPFDLIVEILCRLPVKLLVQLRCLCKSFYSLISDPKFARKHLCLSIKRRRYILSSINDSNKLLFFDSPIPSTSSFTLTQLNHPFTSENNGYPKPLSLSSCDGILCFVFDDNSTILWNPSIRKFKLLSPLKNPMKSVICSSSFGYDHFNENYKVIAITFSKDKGNEVNVHALGTDSWRTIEDYPCPHPIYRPGVLVSGAVNWMVYDASSNSSVIVSLDLEKESYQKFSHPYLENDYYSNLGVVEGCLCIFAHWKMLFDVWIMNEYGNKESWTRLYSCVPFTVDRGLHLRPNALYISKDNQLLMDFYEFNSNKSMFVDYDLKNGTLKSFEIQNIDRWVDPEVYIESLISPCN